MPDAIGPAFIAQTRVQVDQERRRIRHCLDQISEQQVWEQPTPQVNSIGTILVHLCGNLGQWFLHGLGGQPDVRDRPAEFSKRVRGGKEELWSRLDAIFAEADRLLAQLSPDTLLDPRRVQGRETHVLGAIYSTTTHLEGHALQIAYITHMLVGDRYVPFWKPATVEEGA